MASKMATNSVWKGCQPRTARKRDRFQPCGTSCSRSMSMSRRRPAFRRSSSRTGLHRGVAEEDGQQQAAPQDTHGILVAAVVSSLVQQVQETLVGDGSQQGVDSLEGRGIGQFVPREEGSAQSRRHGKTSREKVLAEKTRNLSPPHRRAGVKIAKKRCWGWDGEGIIDIFGGEQKKKAENIRESTRFRKRARASQVYYQRCLPPPLWYNLPSFGRRPPRRSEKRRGG